MLADTTIVFSEAQDERTARPHCVHNCLLILDSDPGPSPGRIPALVATATACTAAPWLRYLPATS